MEVILLKKVANLGNIGDRVKVKSGYGRNYLLPTSRATLVTTKNVAKFEAMRSVLEQKAAQDLTDAEGRATVLKDHKLTIAAKAGSEGKLFGSIGTSDVAEAMTAAGFPVSRAEVRLPNGPIRIVGEHALVLHLHTDINVDITVVVVSQD
ncbi:MAG: 50S ribosomal protein L9 [Pseudomonadota bacterium]|jgi:large subunit ribosomal protein L9